MNTDVVMMKDLSHVDIQKLKQFTIVNQNTINAAVADKVVEEFLNNYMGWKDIVGYMVNGEDGEWLYGAALCTYSGNLYLSNLLSVDMTKLLCDELSDYEGKVEYMYGLKLKMSELLIYNNHMYLEAYLKKTLSPHSPDPLFSYIFIFLKNGHLQQH